jgi:hypothetical protein
MKSGEYEMKNKIRFIILIIGISSGRYSYSGTILSSEGVGTPFSLSDARTMGMGGIDIANDDPYSIPLANPAGLRFLNATRLSIHYLYENNHYKDRSYSAVSRYSNFDGFRFAMPLGKGLQIAMGLNPLTNVDYQLSFPKDLSGTLYTKSVEGSGGLNRFSCSVCWGILPNFAFGFTGNFIFGKINEIWEINFQESDFSSTYNLFSTHYSGYNLNSGIIFGPFHSLILGAVFSPEFALDTETNIYSIPDSLNHKGSFSLPASWGIGATWSLSRSTLIGIDFYKQNWKDLKIDNPYEAGTQNTVRISVGGEFVSSRNPSDSYFKRIPCRMGFTYQPYHRLDPDGNSIIELSGSVGFGFPMLMNASQIDIALCYGKRGSLNANGLTENLFRIKLSMSGAEKWFKRSQ